MMQNTLLEPQNVIPSWEGGDDERNEVSLTMRTIQKEYNVTQRARYAKTKELEDMKVSTVSNFKLLFN
jgi:hypothetical protein